MLLLRPNKSPLETAFISDAGDEMRDD